jgi:hypothetical protein
MGPNPLWLLEDLLKDVVLEPGMRVLDLGCGRGLTSTFLAKEYDVDVVAADLWIKASANRERFSRDGVSTQVTAVDVEAHALPFLFDESVEVAASVLPVAGHLAMGEFDPGEPFRALAAIHLCGVDADGTAMVMRDRGAQHLESDDDIRSAGRGQGQAFAVGAVEGVKSHRGRSGGRPCFVEQCGQSDPGPVDLGYAPPSHALEVAHESGCGMA